MPEKLVTGEVKEGERTVRLAGESGLPPGITFRVYGTDSLRWQFTGVTRGNKMSVRFDRDRFEPKDPTAPSGEPRLLETDRKDSNVAEVDRPPVIKGEVNDNSSEGRYFYKVYLIHPIDGDIELRCIGTGWSALEWGGGDKSGKPRGVGD